MNSRLNGDESGLVAYYKLNDRSGSTATDSAGGNDGTLNNGPTWWYPEWTSGNIYFSGEDNTPLQNTINYLDDSIYSINADEVEIKEAGVYEVSYTMTWDDRNSGDRHRIISWLERNGSEIKPSRQHNYSRGAAEGRRNHTSVNAQYAFNSGDVVQLKVRAEGGGIVTKEAYLTMVKLTIPEKPFSINSKGIIDVKRLLQKAPTQGLIGYWPLNGDAEDYSGFENHGTINGAVPVQGLGQIAYYFDGMEGAGDNDYIDTNWINDRGQTYTLSAIVSTRHSGQLIGNNPPSHGGLSLYIDKDGNLVMSSNNGEESGYASTLMGVSDWYYCVGVADVPNREIRLYLNGELKTVTTGWNGGYGKVMSKLFIGSDDVSNPEWNYTGKIQEVRIYNRPLTEEEIQVMYDLTVGNEKIKVTDDAVYIKNQIIEY
jgi:hypothetical protein